MFDFLKRQSSFSKFSKRKYVYLDKDKEWLFCFKKREIIEHKDCDYYEHNLECKKNNDPWNRTHSSHTVAGWCYATDHHPVLNQCRYCLDERQQVEKYRLSDEAVEWLEFWEKRKKYD